MGQEHYKYCGIIAGYNEYIMKLQSQIIKELKSIDAKLDSNILQKFRLEKRKLQLLQHVEVPMIKNPNISPNNSDCKTPATQSPSTSCIITKPLKRSPPPVTNPSKVLRELFYKGELSDNDLIKAATNFDPATSK